jgi:hypothetical protein
MTLKQLKALLAAGMFSSALLAGTTYAAEVTADTSGKVKTTTEDIVSKDKKVSGVKKSKKSSEAKHAVSKKTADEHACGGASGCGTKP